MLLRAILITLLKHPHVNVRHVVFCDEEGERVEAVSRDPKVDSFELDLLGASYAALMARLSGEAGGVGDPKELRLRSVHPEKIVWVQGLLYGYYLVVVAERDERCHQLESALEDVALALADHM